MIEEVVDLRESAPFLADVLISYGLETVEMLYVDGCRLWGLALVGILGVRLAVERAVCERESGLRRDPVPLEVDVPPLITLAESSDKSDKLSLASTGFSRFFRKLKMEASDMRLLLELGGPCSLLLVSWYAKEAWSSASSCGFRLASLDFRLSIVAGI